MSEVRVVLCAFPAAAEARQIGTVLVEKQHAACVNLLPGVASVYRWKDKVQSGSEVLAIIKTSAAALPGLERNSPICTPTRCPKSWPSTRRTSPRTIPSGYYDHWTSRM